MEATCGEFGDNVPRLVVAVNKLRCEQYQRCRKLTNCEKEFAEVAATRTGAADRLGAVDGADVNKHDHGNNDDINAYDRAMETEILDDEYEQNVMEINTTTPLQNQVINSAKMLSKKQQVFKV